MRGAIMEYKGYHFEVQSQGTMTQFQYEDLIKLLEQKKPKRICELGSGQSTKIFEQYCKRYNAYLVSIEHNEEWKKENSIIFPLVEYSSLKIGDKFFFNCNKYEGFEQWLEKQEPFDFVLIDGPLGWGFRQGYSYNRIQIVDFPLMNKLNQNSIVLYHDSQRKNAKTTLEEFEKILSEKGIRIFSKSCDDLQKRQLTVYRLL